METYNERDGWVGWEDLSYFLFVSNFQIYCTFMLCSLNDTNPANIIFIIGCRARKSEKCRGG